MEESRNGTIPGTISVLGAQYSGSGAVFEYLSGRPDVCDPLRGKEVSIVQSPYGILSFYLTVYKSFYPVAASESLSRLEWLLRKADRPKRGAFQGYNLGAFVPHYQQKVSRYLEQIVAVEYQFRSQFHWLNKKPVRSYFETRFDRLRRQARFHVESLPVSEDAFVKATREFLASLGEEVIQENIHSAAILYNQAGSYWCPELSALLLPHVRGIITVSRDPRDQFAELKVNKGITDVNTFIMWHQQTFNKRNRTANVRDSTVYDVRFEDFVRDHENQVKRLCAFLEIDCSLQSSYEPALSKKNIGKYREQLTDFEIKTIERSLTDFCVDTKNDHDRVID